MTSSDSHDPRARQRGFTLLEVMLAFAILAGVTAYATNIFVNNVEKGGNAVSRRELREAGDTIFRKILYEWDNYKDGYRQTLDEAYAKFARLRGRAYDRWAKYRVELEKKSVPVAGTTPEGEESMFGTTETTTAAPTGETPAEGEELATGKSLTRVTIRIYLEEDEDPKPLLVLNTLVDADKGQLDAE